MIVSFENDDTCKPSQPARCKRQSQHEGIAGIKGRAVQSKDAPQYIVTAPSTRSQHTAHGHSTQHPVRGHSTQYGHSTQRTVTAENRSAQSQHPPTHLPPKVPQRRVQPVERADVALRLRLELRRGDLAPIGLQAPVSTRSAGSGYEEHSQ